MAKYVVWSPAMGGWNKYHIARVNELSSGIYLRPLCGGNQGATVSQWWVDMRDKISPDAPADHRPLQSFDNQCDKCQTKWWSLRQDEGYPTTGIFAV